MSPVSQAFAQFDDAYAALLTAAADVRRALAAEAKQEPPPPVLVIVSVVAEHYQLSPADILSRNRQAHVALARHVAMYLARTLTAQSYVALGVVFARDHGAVMHGFSGIEARASIDRQFAETLKHLRTRCAAAVCRR